MKTLKELADKVNDVFECDIREKTRKRNTIYAKKVYYRLAKRKFPKKILDALGSEIGQNHCMALHHLNNFDCIYDSHKKIYLQIAESIGLDWEDIGVYLTQEQIVISEINKHINKFSLNELKDLKEFLKQRNPNK